MPPENTTRPAFGQPGWRRRMQDTYNWDKEFMAVGVILVLVLLSIGFVHADDNTGQAPTPAPDPKDVGSGPSLTRCDTDEYFLPMPAWSSFHRMPALPAVLTPMGAVADKPKPSPAAVAETKPDMPPMPKKLPQVGPLASSSQPAPPAKDTPTLEAISPFLQWVHDHPQEAAAAARQQAAVANGTSAGAPVPAPDPYWMPPMIDDSAPSGGNGSAAIYSQPQK